MSLFWSQLGLGPSPTTQIANASDHSVMAMVDSDRERVDKAAINIGKIGAKVKTEIYHIASSNGFTEVKPRHWLPFTPSISRQDQSVYITWFYIDPNDMMRGPCTAYPVRNNKSIIIGRDMAIHPTKMGKLWVDDGNINHEP